MNFQNHFSNLLRLLKMEREEDRKQYEGKIRNRSIADRKKDGVTWYPVVVSRSYLGTGEKWCLQLERPDIQTRHSFQSGSSVSVFSNDGSQRFFSANGIISRISDKYMTVMLMRDDPPGWIDEGKLGVDLLFDESTYDEMEWAGRRLMQTTTGRLSELIPVLGGALVPAFEKISDIRHPGLNESQNEALRMIVAAKDLALVHGPPGTGKTTTLVEAIKEVVSIEKQVLVTAPSNSAVDLLVERLSAQGVRVLRLGHPARVTEEVINTTLDSRLADHPDSKTLKDLRKKSEEMNLLGKKHKRHFGRDERVQRRMLLEESRKLKEEALALEDYMIRDEIHKAEVIACTLIGANSTYLQKHYFKTLFIDESSQALELAAWIPVMKAHRVVMAGDHWQLPPTVKSVEAEKSGFGETIFLRCIQAYHSDRMLEIQYRMHPDIQQFPNKKFYGGKLRTAPEIDRRRIIFSPAVRFIDTAGCGYEEQLNPETLSSYNPEEAELLLKMINFYCGEHSELASMSVGVITPYKAQTEFIRERLNRINTVSEITVNTVDAYQGQERDAIFISLVRSNPSGEIGFLADVRRMNVAMTRARHFLVMIGDSATLATHPFFEDLIQDMQNRNLYFSAFEFGVLDV